MHIRDLIADRETVPEATIEAGADSPADVPEPESPSLAETPETAAAPSFDPAELQTRLDATEMRAAQLEETLAALLYGGDQPQDGNAGGQPQFDLNQIGQLDPFNEDFGQQLAGLLVATQQQTVNQIAQLVQHVTAPLEQQREQETIQQGQANLQDILADDISRNGEFHADPNVDQRARDMVEKRAQEMYLELANRHGGHEAVVAYGLGPRVAEQAMTNAAAEIRDLFKAVAGTAIVTEKNRLATLAGVPGEPGAATGAVEGPGRFETGRSVVDYYAGRAQSLTSAA